MDRPFFGEKLESLMQDLNPVLEEIAQRSRPSGWRNSVFVVLTSDSFIKARKAGRATDAPVSFLPRVRGVSNPTKPPATKSGVKPTNQVSRLSLVVPVLPAMM